MSIPTPDFDSLARLYRWLEYFSFGPLLQNARCDYLEEASRRKSALILGDGDGRFTARLLQANSTARVHAVDASLAMLATLARNCKQNSSHLTTEQADLRHWSPQPGARFDLIVTHFFLDCLTTVEIATLASRIFPALQPGALWLVSDFAIPKTAFGRFIATPLVRFLYVAFYLLTGLTVNRLPNHELALSESGWGILTSHKRFFGLLISELWLLQQNNPGVPSENVHTG